MIELINFTELNYDEKTMVLEWRNHDNIRKWMFIQDKITLNNHLRYIDALTSKTDRAYFLVKVDSEAIGVIDFTDINTDQAEIGLYAKPNIRGMGTVLMESIINHGFNILKVKTLVSEVFEENESAIKLYQKFGFQKVNKKENILVMELRNENR